MNPSATAPVTTALVILPFEVAALHAASFNLLPIGARKRPMIKWAPLQDRAATLEALLSWHVEFSPPVWANITGKTSGRITLDADGELGRATFQRIGLTDLAHRATPSGGLHADFAWPGFHVATINQGNSVWLREHLPGVDVRGDGGYANVTGADHRGAYRWLRDFEPHPWALLEQLA